MKKISLILFILFSSFSYAQKEINITFNKLEIKYIIFDNDKNYKVDLFVKNNSESNIYLPELINDDLNFFILGNRLYLYYGLTFSLLGEQNPMGNSNLIDLKSKEFYSRTITILKKNLIRVDTLCVGIEYLPRLSKKHRKKLEISNMNYSKEINNFYSEYKW